MAKVSDVYSKNGTVVAPNGKEYTNLFFALKAYGLDEEEFKIRLENGYSIREAFVGKDYSCGLKFNDDGYLHDGFGHTFKDLESMCKFHNADIHWFENLYEVTGNVKLSLLQKPEHKTEKFIQSCKEELEKKNREEKELNNEKNRQEREEEKQRQKNALARKILKKYGEYYLNTYKSMTEQRAFQIINLGDYLRQFRLLSYDERRIYERAELALKFKTCVHSSKEDPNKKLVDSVLGSFVSPELKKYLKKKDSAKDYYSRKKDIIEDVLKDNKSSISEEKPFIKSVNTVKMTDMEKGSKSYSDSLSLTKFSSREELNAKRKEVREKRSKAGKISAEKRKEQKMMSENTYTKQNKDYSEVEEETIRILQAYLGELQSF